MYQWNLSKHESFTKHQNQVQSLFISRKSAFAFKSAFGIFTSFKSAFIISVSYDPYSTFHIGYLYISVHISPLSRARCDKSDE